MKINETPRIGNINSYKRAADQRTPGSADKKSKKDEVQISSEALELLNTQGSDEQRKKIEDLKQSVDSGTYFVSAQKIADKLFPYIK